MSQIKPQITSVIAPFQTRPEEFHIIEANGKQIAMVPIDRLNTLRSNNFGFRIMSIGVAVGAIAAGLSMLLPAMKPAAPIVVREQAPPVIVDRNCIAFCRP